MTLGWKGLYFTMTRGKKGHWRMGGIKQELFQKYFLFHISQTESSDLFTFFLKWGYCQPAKSLFSELTGTANSYLMMRKKVATSSRFIYATESLLLNETRCNFSNPLFLFSPKVSIMVLLKRVRRNFFFTV